MVLDSISIRQITTQRRAKPARRNKNGLHAACIPFYPSSSRQIDPHGD
jgi:hypothetical protein